MRDLRTLNQTDGQKIESDEVLKRIGDLAYRNAGTLSKMSLFDEGKALITSGLRVIPDSGMTVMIPSGVVFQRSGVDVFPTLQVDDQTVTLDAASGVPRVDIIEAQIASIEDKVDFGLIGVASGTSLAISVQEIKRDIQYYLAVRKQTSTTSSSAATAGILQGVVSIPGTIDLSNKYLIALADGEDGDFQEIDCRGVTPNATTQAEIITALNTAVGRTIATSGASNTIVLTGNGTGVQSKFVIKPPVTDPDKDALTVIFGVSTGGSYKYTYKGLNSWFKLAEIDVEAFDSIITENQIRNINEKSTWTGEGGDILVHNTIYEKNIDEWNSYSSTRTYSLGDIVFIENNQYVSLENSNSNNYPITSPDFWEIAPSFSELTRKYQSAQVIWSGLKNIDDFRHPDYAQWLFSGYYEQDGNSYRAYKVHLDGTQITGDSDLESIFDVGGSDEYFLLDVLAPDTGTRTLPDLRGRTLRAVDDSGSTNLTEDVGVVQEDQFQGHDRGVEQSGAGGAVVRSMNALAVSVTDVSNPILGDVGITSNYYDDGTNGVPRRGKDTRMMNYTVGVPFVYVLLPV